MDIVEKPNCPSIDPAACRFIEIAKDQPQYRTLPAWVFVDGRVYSEWKPTEEELSRLIDGAPIGLWLSTFNQPLQPVRLEVGGIPVMAAPANPEPTTGKPKATKAPKPS